MAYPMRAQFPRVTTKSPCAIQICTTLLLLGLNFALPFGSSAYAQDFDLQAHRGGLGLFTESTLEAFSNALDLGVTTLELDTQVTRDGYVVVTHDRQVLAHRCLDTVPVSVGDRQFPYVGKYIKDLTLAQVQTLDCGSQRAAGHPEQQTVPGARLLLLAEVFDLVRSQGSEDVMLNIETKIEAGAPQETVAREPFVRAVLAEIRAHDMLERVTIQSFDWGALMLVRELEPTLPIIALSNAQPFLRCGEAGVSPWTGGIDMDDFDCNLPAAAASFGADGISPVHGLPQDGRITDSDYELFATAELVQQAHVLGLKVIPWTVDDEATLEFLIELGVDGIITNYPDRLSK